MSHEFPLPPGIGPHNHVCNERTCFYVGTEVECLCGRIWKYLKVSKPGEPEFRRYVTFPPMKFRPKVKRR